MKCPKCNMEMQRIAKTVNGYDGTYTFWLCNGEGRFPRKHIIKTEEWGRNVYFYEIGEWKMISQGVA